MKQFAEKLIKRNYTKRMLAILIAAVVLLTAVAVLIPATLHKQITEFRTLSPSIYTTNTIESFNSALRKVTNRKAAFPNAAAVMKVLYLRKLDIAAKWVMPYPNWGIIQGKLDLLLGTWWDT